MVELVYVSRAVYRFDQQQLEALLEVSRNKNLRLDITGLLLYDGYGTFIQALEGPDDQVEQLFAVIKADSRHCHVNKIGHRHITTRQFPDWQMGFKILSTTPVLDIPGFSQFMASPEKPDYINKHHSFAFSMLQYFRDSK